MNVSRWVTLNLLTGALASTVAMSAFAGEGGRPDKPGKERAHTRGQITQVNANGSTFTIEGQDGVKTFTATAETKFNRRAEATLNDLQTGQYVKVGGQLADGGSSIQAHHIGVMDIPQGGKGQHGQGQRGQKNAPAEQGMVTGTLQRNGDQLSVAADDGKTVAIVTNEQTRVTAPAAASFADLKVGGYAMAMGRVDGDAVIAVHVVIMPEKPQGKGQGQGHQGKGTQGKGPHGPKGPA